MSFVLSSAVITQLGSLSSAGNYSGAYQLIVDSISDSDGNPLSGVDHEVWLWFYGALSTNRDVGPFSDFIRAYTENQFEIRTGQSFSPTSLQEASDNIAREVIDGIIDRTGTLPTLNQIGVDDATEVAAEILNDSALWSGNLLFVGLGDRSFFDDAILEDPADTYDLLTLAESMASAIGANTLSEWQDALEDLAEDAIVDAAGVPISTALTTARDVVVGNTFLISNVILNANSFVNDAYAGRLGVFSTTLLNRVLGTNSAADTLQGSDLIDIYHGGELDDTLVGSLGIDLLDGGDGYDLLDYSTLSQPLLVTFDNKISEVPFAAEIKSTGTLGSDDWAFNIEMLVLGDDADQVTALSGASSTLTDLNTAGGDDVVNLSQYTGAIGIDGGAGNDEITLGAGGGSAFGGEGADTVTGGAGDDILGNIHAPTFDYTALTSAEIDAILASENDGAPTILDGGAGDDIYIIDYSSTIEGVRPITPNGAVFFDIQDGDAGTKIYLRDIATGQIDTIGGELKSLQILSNPARLFQEFGDGGVLLYQCTVPAEYRTFYYFEGASGAVYVVGTETTGGGDPPCDPNVEDPGQGPSGPPPPFNPATANFATARFDSMAAFIAADYSIEAFDTSAGGMTLFIRSTDNGNGNLLLSDLVAGDYVELGLTAPTPSTEPSTSSGVSVNAVTGGYSSTGTSGNDILSALSGTQTASMMAGDDIVVTGDGNDTIDGGAGDDELQSGDGDDLIDGGDDNDTLQGGSGLDQLNGEGGNDAVYGGNGQDTLSGGQGFDWLSGDDGADNISGGDDDDTVTGGAGADSITGDAGADLIYGDEDDDTLIGGAGADTLDGGDGADTADYLSSSSAVVVRLNTGFTSGGDAAGDVLASIENLVGTAFDDGLAGDDNDNALTGAGGNDELTGRDGADTIKGGAGNDTIFGGAGADSVLAGTGADYVSGGSENDVIDGGGGNDELSGGNQNDSITGGDGVDTIFGSDGDDTLFGGAHDDLISGASNNDIINGGGGDDTLFGGRQNDILTGGAGDDTFLYSGGEIDVITDFTAGAASDDVIELSGLGAAFDTYTEVIAAASDDGTDTTIDFGNGDYIVLEGVLVSQLHQDDFAFA